MNVERAWSFFNGPWKGYKYVMAPMVDQSELPFRMLARGFQPNMVCYTPMLHSKCFAADASYREEHFTTCEADRPLVAQFCGNDPATVVAAAKLVADKVDAVDLNLGCPQGIARRGRYGAFLMKEFDLVKEIVSAMVKEVGCPITVKIRVFDDVESTVKFARMLEDCGIVLLTVHGRTINQKPNKSFRANWETIREVKKALQIPVIANGNLQKFSDIEECLRVTGCDGVMSAESLLVNPALFTPTDILLPHKIASQYLQYVKRYPVPVRMVKSHLFDFCNDILRTHVDLREKLVTSSTFEHMENFVTALSERLESGDDCPINFVSQVQSKRRKKQALKAANGNEDDDDVDDVDDVDKVVDINNTTNNCNSNNNNCN